MRTRQGRYGMDGNSQHERELRAARNQSLFRAVNDRLRDLNDAVAALSDTFVIACECADTTCIATLEISGEEYAAVRKQPRQFAVLPGHVYPDVETVVSESDRYVVVEKVAAAGELAEKLDLAP